MTSIHSRTPPSRAFYGWRIVGVTFLTLFVSVGFSFYSFGPFFKALAAEFGGSRMGVGLGLSVFFLTNGLLAPYLGRAVSRGNIKRLMTFGVLMLCTGFAVISRVTSLFQFYLVLGTMLAVGAACIGGLVASALVANWFVRRRGMALGISTMGISVSGVVMAPTATLLIQTFGWRHTFLVYSLLTLCLVLPAIRWLVIDEPEVIGLHPDGDAAPEAPTPTPPAVGWRSTMSEANFWIIAGVIGLNMCANGAILTHIIPHATDLGYSPGRSSLILSVIAGFGVLGKILFGWISDQFDKRLAVWISSGLQGIAVASFLVVDSFTLLLLAGCVFGLGMGGLVPLWGTLIGATFGRRLFGRVMGLMTPVMLPLQTLGVPLAGYIHDRTASYDLAFQIFVGAYASAVVLLFFLAIPETEPGRAVKSRPT